MADTTNYGWHKPVDGGSSGAWGVLVDAVFDGIDTDLKVVDDAQVASAAVAAAALPAAGGTCTGAVDFLSFREKVTVLGSTGAGTVDINLALSSVFTATVNGAVTFTFSNVPATAPYATRLRLILTLSGNRAVTLPASVVLIGGGAQILTSGVTYCLDLLTVDAGTTWYAIATYRSDTLPVFWP